MRTSTCPRLADKPMASGLHVIDCRSDPRWLERTLEEVRIVGYAVVEGVLDPAICARTREAMYAVRERFVAEIGEERLRAAGELGVLRLMLRYDDHFVRLLEVPEVLAVVAETVSETAILHLQNGFILPPAAPEDLAPADVFQLQFHMDFRRVLNGYLMSINTLLAIDDFTAENGGTLVVPATHHLDDAPSQEYLQLHSVAVECPAGSMIVFDSTLWHAAGKNTSGKDRVGVNQQFTRSYVKQQVDYVRALGDEFVLAQTPRTQQLLGWYTRVVTSLDEYYSPPEERLYRSGQG
jgi:ectoine hydroxylase-related dioxygenase (phytanoyl-CoA dioxygenase family)